MTREEAIRELKADYCGNRIICELYPDQCNREDCEIWLAIKALETQPDGNAVSRKDAIRIVDSIDTWQAGWRGNAIESLKALPSAQPEIIRCKDCKHNPKYEWFGCPMSHLNEKQRPETAWCWKGERRTDDER